VSSPPHCDCHLTGGDAWLRMIDDDVQLQNFGVHTPHGVEEGKGQGGLSTSRQYGNALLGVRCQCEDYIFACDK